MTEFTFKTYRVEWQVNVIEVDQYERQTGTLSSVPFATREEALAYRETVAHEHKFVSGRWIPNNAPHGYVQCEIQYKEVLVK